MWQIKKPWTLNLEPYGHLKVHRSIKQFLQKSKMLIPPSDFYLLGQRRKKLSHFLWDACWPSFTAETVFIPSKTQRRLLPQSSEADYYSNKSLKNSKALLVRLLFSFIGLLFFGCKGGDCEMLAKMMGGLPQAPQRHGNTSLSAEDQGSIFRILYSILHLGNVFFERYEVQWNSSNGSSSLGFPHAAVVWCSFSSLMN